MKLIQQPLTLKVSNTLPEENAFNTARGRHGALLPNSIRCLISGGSNCGKTNVMVELIINANGLRFKNIYLYTKTPHQPKYKFLKDVFDGIKGIGYHVFAENEEVIPPSDARPDSIFIFDDVACNNKQSIMKEYFSLGRHSGVECFYLTQSFAAVPKLLLRDNCNLIVLFKQDDLNLRHIYHDYCSTDMSFEYFKKIAGLCWQDKYGFLVISKEDPLDCGRYRRGFDVFIQIENQSNSLNTSSPKVKNGTLRIDNQSSSSNQEKIQ